MVFNLGERLRPLVLALALGVTAGCLSKPKPGEPLRQMEIPAPEGAGFGPVLGGTVQVSPDGRRLAFGYWQGRPCRARCTTRFPHALAPGVRRSRQT